LIVDDDDEFLRSRHEHEDKQLEGYVKEDAASTTGATAAMGSIGSGLSQRQRCQAREVSEVCSILKD
jgi:hypothetical protein